MKLAGFAFASSWIVLAVVSCSSPGEPSTKVPSTSGDGVASTAEDAGLPTQSRHSRDEDETLTRVQALSAKARLAKQNGDLIGARALAKEAIDAILVEGEANDTYPRISELFTLSYLADSLNEMLAAQRATTRVQRFYSSQSLSHGSDRKRDTLPPPTVVDGKGEPHAKKPQSTEGLDGSKATSAGAPKPGDEPSAKTKEQIDLERELALRDQVVERMSQAGPADDPDLLEQRMLLARLHELRGDIDAANEQYAQVLASLARILAKGHPAMDDPKLQPIRRQLGERALARGDFATAAGLYQQAVEVYTPTRPHDDADLIDAQQGHAEALTGLGDLARAQPLLAGVLETRTQKLGADDPATQVAREHLTTVLEKREQQVAGLEAKGELEQARALQQEVLDGFRLLPPERPDHLRAKERMASLLQRQCTFDGVLALRQDILEILSQTTPVDSQALAEASRELAAVLRVMGRVSEARVIEQKIINSSARN